MTQYDKCVKINIARDAVTVSNFPVLRSKMNSLKGNSRKVGRTSVGFAAVSTERSILPPKGGITMTIVTLSDLLQLGILICSIVSLVLTAMFCNIKRK